MGMMIIGSKVMDNYEQLGIDTKTPRFAWILDADGRDEKQTAYRIIVASNESNIDSNTGDIWDSCKVLSANQYSVVFAGSSMPEYWDGSCSQQHAMMGHGRGMVLQFCCWNRALCSNGTEIPVTKPIIYQFNHDLLVGKTVDLSQLLL